jgi:hypothetical protein
MSPAVLAGRAAIATIEGLGFTLLPPERIGRMTVARATRTVGVTPVRVEHAGNGDVDALLKLATYVSAA